VPALAHDLQTSNGHRTVAIARLADELSLQQLEIFCQWLGHAVASCWVIDRAKKEVDCLTASGCQGVVSQPFRILVVRLNKGSSSPNTQQHWAAHHQ